MRSLRALFIVAMLMAAGCGGDDGSPTGNSSPTPVSGTVYKGAVDGAEVTIHAVSPTGGLTQVGGPFTTDASGAYAGEVPAGHGGWHLVVAEGGSYVDESTGATVNITTSMMGMINLRGANVGSVTPFTHAAAANMFGRLGGGQNVQTAFSSANSELADVFGFDPSNIEPELGDTPQEGVARGVNEQVYAALIAGICELIEDAPGLSPTFDSADRWDLVVALMEDLSDGVLDGEDVFGVPIMVDPDGAGGSGPLALPQLDAAGIGALVDAARDWAATHFPGLTIPDYDMSDFGDFESSFGAFESTGTLTVTGPGAADFGGNFTPTVVAVVENQGGLGVAFAEGTPPRSIGIGYTPVQGIGVAAVSAQIAEKVWQGQGLPVQGVTLTIHSGDHYEAVFNNATLFRTGGGSITLNGTLSAER